MTIPAGGDRVRTFVERAAEYRHGDEALCRRSLEVRGWSIRHRKRHLEQAISFEVEVEDGEAAALILMLRRVADCWTVHRLCKVRDRGGPPPVFPIPTGDYAPELQVLSLGGGIVLLHTSQIDQIRSLAGAMRRGALSVAARPRVTVALAFNHVLGLPRLSGQVEGLASYAAVAAVWRCSFS